MVGCGWGASAKVGCEWGARTAASEARFRHSPRSRRPAPSKTAQAVVRFAATQASRYCTDPKAARRPVCDFVRRVVVPAGDLAIASVPSTPTYRRSGEHAIDGRPTEEAAGPAWRTGPRRGHADRAWRPARPRGSARRRSRQLRDHGYWGVSVFAEVGGFDVAWIASNKLSGARWLVVFRAGDVLASGLDLWDTGQSPHYDVVHQDIDELVARLVACPHRIIRNPTEPPGGSR